MWSSILLALALQGADTAAARDSAAIREAARVYFKMDAADVAKAELTIKADTAWVTSRGKVSWTTIRLHRTEKVWRVQPGEIRGIR